MNRVFQVIWSHAIGAWIVVSEFATRGGRVSQSHDARGSFARHRLFGALLLVIGPCSGAYAQSLYWDGTDTGANANGGTGTWQDGVANWDNAALGGVNTPWSSALPNDAEFGGVAGTVTIAPGGVTADDLTFTNLYTLTGGTLRLDGDPVISNNNTVAINAVIAGDDGITKSGAGSLGIEHDATFATTIVDGGSLAIAAGTTFASQHTQLAAGTTLRIAGNFTGTTGDDTFDSAGAVIGAVNLGAGNDRATFSGGDLSRMTTLDGGTGSDTLAFSRMTLQDTALPAFANIERMALVDGSTLRMTRALDLAGGTLAIDPTSLLTAAVDVSVAGSIDNAGTLRIGPGRLAIAGDYTGRGNALLEVVVSPALGTAGGVDITGDVHGLTRIAFDSDGSTVTQATAIKVIDSPNDAAGEGTFTTARTAAGFVRLNGSYLDWSFDKDAADGAWYLRTEADAVLPEVPGYSIVPAIGFASTRAPIGIAFDRVEGDDRDCGQQDTQAGKSQARFDDCHGAWVALGVDEIEMGANPGAAFSGDGSTLFVGADIFGHERASSRFRGGVMAGLQRGNYWTTGATSGPMPANSAANVRTKTGGFGAYGSYAWENGAHLDGVAIGQLHANHVGTPDGFMQKVIGESASVSLRGGKPFAPAQGWTLEPRLQVGATRSLWQDLVDDNGNRIALVDDTVGTARADLRIQRAFDSAGGTHWQPWMTVGLEDTFGEETNAATVGNSLAMPNHALDLSATVDVGFEASVAGKVSWYGSLSYASSLRGTDAERSEATLGLRVRW